MEKDTSVHHEHRMKLAKEDKESKKSKKIEKIWYELTKKDQKKGFKVVKCFKTKSGVIRQFAGWEKDAKNPISLATLKKTYEVKTV